MHAWPSVDASQGHHYQPPNASPLCESCPSCPRGLLCWACSQPLDNGHVRLRRCVMVATAKQLHVASICGCLCSGGSCVAGYHPTSPTDDRLSASLRGLGPGWVVIVGVVVGSVSEESRFGVFGRRAWQAASGFSWRPGSTNMWKVSHFGGGGGKSVLSHTETRVDDTRSNGFFAQSQSFLFGHAAIWGNTHFGNCPRAKHRGVFSSRLYFQVGMREHEEGEEEWDSGEMSGILRFVVPYITPS